MNTSRLAAIPPGNYVLGMEYAQSPHPGTLCIIAVDRLCVRRREVKRRDSVTPRSSSITRENHPVDGPSAWAARDHTKAYERWPHEELPSLEEDHGSCSLALPRSEDTDECTTRGGEGRGAACRNHVNVNTR